MSSKVIRIPRSKVVDAKAGRKSQQIKATQYAETVSLETPKRFYINQNVPHEL